MKTAHDIIVRPIITENSMDLMAAKTYVFEVAKDSTKPEIAKAVEEVFKADKVKVASVRTINMKKKPKRLGVHFGYTSEWKKAIVTLTADSGEIEFFAGLN
jgi:large subunit ribosomal protein L23